jgi:hypothetical protein
MRATEHEHPAALRRQGRERLPGQLQILPRRHHPLLRRRIAGKLHFIHVELPVQVMAAPAAELTCGEIGGDAVQQRPPYLRRPRATVPVAKKAGVTFLGDLLGIRFT